MEHKFETKVYYQDTDAYGVVWHGHYLRWMERGRIDFCDELGFNLVELEKEDIVLPVASIDIKYKNSAKLNDDLIVVSKIAELKPLYVVFNQKIVDKNSDKVFIDANIKVVAVNNQGKLYRKFPQKLYDAFAGLVE